MKHFRYILSFLTFLLFLPLQNATAGTSTLHAILVADTIHDIRSVTLPDVKRWQKELKVISQHAKMVLKEKTFDGMEFNKEKIKNYIQELKVKPSDAVIFFFSGHGYRTYQKKTPWPFLTFEFCKPGLDVQWIISTVRGKKPRFAIVMSDCCNNFMENGMFGNETKNVQMKLKPISAQVSGYQQLFSKAKGCIAISSSKQGQFSYGSHLGGLYTQCFFISLNREIKEKKPSWKRLLERANGFINHIQSPVCEVYTE